VATGRIIFLHQGDDGTVHGYVRDDQIKTADRKDLNVFFDVRCLQASATISHGDQVEFEYDLNDRTSIVPRMRFDSMRVIEE
jgi:hypothetical protein